MRNMEQRLDCIIKSGTIESVDDDKIKVKIQNNSACSMCYSKGVCTSLGSGERIIEVENDNIPLMKPGDKVDIEMISSSGWIAVIIGYVVPFILLILTLIISSNYLSEAIAALLSLIVLVPYYLSLYILRKRMKRYFHFRISGR